MGAIPDKGRAARVHRAQDVADIFERLKAAEPPNVVKLAALGIESAATIAVVRGQRAFDLLRRKPRASEAILVEEHLILHGAAAEAGIVGDASRGSELRLNRPVLECLEFGRRPVGALQR